MKIELRRGGCTAVADTMGGELVSFRDEQGTEYIWGGDPEIWAGRNPNLFPVVGNLMDGRSTAGWRLKEKPMRWPATALPAGLSLRWRSRGRTMR